ncbi:MAG: crotonobetaine/carnitine-CoA ligase [Halioglobus sp.]
MNKLDLHDTSDRIFSKMLSRQAQKSPDTQFLITDAVSITFDQAEQITSRLAAGFLKLDLKKGDRVALLMGNRVEMVLLALAINKLGAIWIPICTDYKGEWLLDTLQRSECEALVTDAQYQARIVEIAPKLAIARKILIDDGQASQLSDAVLYSDLAASEPVELDDGELDYGDTCAILWTSGTTGKSKGVMQSYNVWVRAIVEGCSVQYDSREGDIIYCVLPLFNTAAWITSIFRALIEGIPCVIEAKFSVTDFWERVEHFKATQTFAIGAMGVFLANAPAREDDAKTPLRVAQIVPMPPDLWGKFEQRFNVKLLRTGLGQSECQLVMTQLENREDVPVYSLGFPIADTKISLRDDDGQEVKVGDPGEICIKPLAPYVLFNGYFNNPEATELGYRDGWYLTGDMAKQDPQTGAYFFVDRKKDALRYAGRNISTLEVESVVRRHPDVADVAVFGIVSEEVESEHEVKINIVLRAGAEQSHESLCEFINANAPHYFVPRYMEFVENLPYTPTNKVQKFKLREIGVTEATWDRKLTSFEVKR